MKKRNTTLHWRKLHTPASLSMLCIKGAMKFNKDRNSYLLFQSPFPFWHLHRLCLCFPEIFQWVCWHATVKDWQSQLVSVDLEIVDMWLFVYSVCFFWTLDLPEGILSNRPCPCVGVFVCVSIIKYLRDRSLFFSIF